MIIKLLKRLYNWFKYTRHDIHVDSEWIRKNRPWW